MWMQKKILLVSFVAMSFTSRFSFAEIEGRHWTNRTQAEQLRIPLEPIPVDHRDPYAPVAWMTKGQFRGRAIDVTIRRPLFRLRANKDTLRYANVYYKNEFWIAEIPVDGVEDVFMQQHDFSSPAPVAHNDLLYQFREGFEVRLISQDQSRARRTVLVPGLLFSGEAMGPKDVGYEGLADLKPRTVLVLRMSAIEERVPVERYNRWVPPDDPKNPFYRIQLRIGDAGYRERMLEVSANMSADYGYDHIYNLLNQNCTTTIYKIINLALRGMPGYRPDYVYGPLFNRLPRATEAGLTLRGI